MPPPTSSAESCSTSPERCTTFVDTSVCAWRAWDELAVACSWTGHRTEGLAAAQRALTARPEDPRLLANVEWLSDLADPAS